MPRISSRNSTSACFASPCASSTSRAGGAGPRSAGEAERHRQRDQPLLGAVVQVALDPAALGVGGVDQPARLSSSVSTRAIGVAVGG